MLRIAIVEDDRNYIQQLQKYLQRYGQESGQAMNISVFTDGDEITEGYRPNYDIILMDIEMCFMNGMTAAQEIRKLDPEVVIIFITNMVQYAIQGYAVGALDYILKPVSYFAFSQRIDRAITRLKSRTRKYITVPVVGGARKLEVSQIYYVEGRNHDLTFHTQVGNLDSRLTLRQVEEQLEGCHFFRGNNSYLINLEHVDGIQDNCAVVRGDLLKLSRPRKNAFMEALTDHLGEVLK